MLLRCWLQVLSRATDADKAASKRTEADANSKAEASGSKPQQSDSTDLDLPDYNQAIISTIGGKCASAIFIYVLTFGLAGFSNIDPYANLNLVSSDITTGAAAGVPVGLLFAAIFLLPIPKLPGTAVPQDVDLPDNYKGQSEVGLDSRQLKSMREVDDSEQPTSEILADISVVLPQDGDTIRRGLWWYSASVLKVRAAFVHTCGSCICHPHNVAWPMQGMHNTTCHAQHRLDHLVKPCAATSALQFDSKLSPPARASHILPFLIAHTRRPHPHKGKPAPRTASTISPLPAFSFPTLFHSPGTLPSIPAQCVASLRPHALPALPRSCC